MFTSNNPINRISKFVINLNLDLSHMKYCELLKIIKSEILN